MAGIKPAMTSNCLSSLVKQPTAFAAIYVPRKDKAPPALMTTVRGQALSSLSLFPPRPREDAPPAGGWSAETALSQGTCIGTSRTPVAACALSAESARLPALHRGDLFSSRAARLGVHVRLAPTRACERIANRSLCRWADPRDAREPELRCLKPAGAAVPAPPPDASPETTTPLKWSGNGGRLARQRRTRED